MYTFGYDKNIIARLTRQRVFSGLTVIVAVFTGLWFLLEYQDTSKTTREDFGPLIIVCMLIVAGGVIGGFIGMLQANFTIENLKKNRIELSNTAVSGMFCKKPESGNNTCEFFEIDMEDIRRVEVDPTPKSIYTLLIHTKYGTYRLCVERADYIVRQIENITNGIPLAEREHKTAHAWLCSCGGVISSWPCRYCGNTNEKKEEQIPEGHWKCMGCGQFVPNETDTCQCGYSRNT